MIRIFRAVDPEARVSLIPDLNKSQVEAIHASVRADARVNGCLSNLLPKFRHELGSCLIWALVRVFRLTLEQSLDVLCLIDKRENLGSTGVGRGLGLPHTKSPLFQELHIGVILFREIEFEYEAIDAEPLPRGRREDGGDAGLDQINRRLLRHLKFKISLHHPRRING